MSARSVSTDATIVTATSWEDYCAKIATVVTSGGVVISITMEDELEELHDLYLLGKAIIDAHHHGDDPITKIDLGSEVQGLLPWWMLESVPAELITGLVGTTVLPVLDHIGLFCTLEVNRSIVVRWVDGKNYWVKSSWPVGVVPTVWRNDVLVDDSEYIYDQTARTITFLEVQPIYDVIKVASDYRVYTGTVNVEGRDDIVSRLYKNGNLITEDNIVYVEDTVTVTFDDTQGRLDVFLLGVENYYIIDRGETYHRDLDDAVSDTDAFGALGQSEVTGDILLQNLMAERHLYDNSYLEGRRKSGGLEIFMLGDAYDTALSTIPDPDLVNHQVVIPAGSINHLYPAWASGTRERTEISGSDLILSNRDWSVGFVIDESESMSLNDPTNLRITAAKDLTVLLAAASETCEFYVEGFGEIIYKYGGWSANLVEVQGWLDECVVKAELTNIYGALHGLWEELATIVSGNCKAVILFTDGIQTVTSIYTLLTVLAEYNSLDYPIKVPIICVGLSENVDVDALSDLASETDGVFFYCSEAGQMLELSEYIVNDIRSVFNTGSWLYEYDFSEKKKITEVSISADYPVGCKVYLRYSTSEDEVTWADDVDVEFVAGIASVNVCARYWKLYLILLGSGGEGPTIHSIDISYIEPGPYELWLNPILVSQPVFQCQFAFVIKPFPTGLIELAVWTNGAETWENCQKIVGFEEDEVSNKLWRGLLLGPYSYENRFVVKFTNRSAEDMIVHDLSFLYSLKGAFL